MNMNPLGSFQQIYPVSVQRKIIVDFQNMEEGLRTIELEPFSNGKYPVTNEAFFEFIRATDYAPDDGFGHSGRDFPSPWGEDRAPSTEKGRHPAVFVCYDDALAYAEFIGGRLPSYLEWIYAAYGNTNRKYPWGDEFRPDLCNVRESKIGETTPVGSYSPQGDSPFGCSDMVGNVWEWTSKRLGMDEEMFLAMGTGWDHYSRQIEIPLNHWYRNHSVGFRIARDLGN